MRCEHVGQLRARDRAVHAVVVGRDPADRGERGLAADPEALALGLVLADPDDRGAALAGDRADHADQVLDLGRRAVELADQQALDVERVAGVAEVLGGVDRRPVHHLEAARDDAVRDDRGDAVARLLGGREAHQQRARASRASSGCAP